MVGFEYELPANSTQTFEVIHVPESNESNANFTGKLLRSVRGQLFDMELV
ncbi:MAG: hypothetical protein ACI959_001591 [Limisphaerales bacterium]|jgi:hypothetical protein